MPERSEFNLRHYLDQDQVAELIRREYRLNGDPIQEETADRWASIFLHHLKYEPGPLSMGLRLRRRPERPTAERLRSFLMVETDWDRA